MAKEPVGFARALVIPTGRSQLLLPGLPSLGAPARVALDAAPRAVTSTPDGSRGFVAAGSQVIAVDLTTRKVSDELDLDRTITGLTLTPDGKRLLASRRGAIDIVDVATLARTGSISLNGAQPGALDVSSDGRRAAVALGRRIAFVDLVGERLLRRKTVGAIGGIRFAPSGQVIWVSTTNGILRGLDRVSARERSRIRLGRGVGTGLAVAPDGRRAAVAANRGGSSVAIVDLRRQRLQTRVRTGKGVGSPVYSEDGSRLYVADGGASTISIVSTRSNKRIAAYWLGAGLRPRGLALRPRATIEPGSAEQEANTGALP